MTDLQDRLDRLAPTVDPDTGLAGVQRRARHLRRRRRTVAAVAATTILVVAVAGAMALVDAGEDAGTRVVTEPDPARPVIEEGWVELRDGPLPDGFLSLSREVTWTGSEFLWWGHDEGATLAGEEGATLIGAAFDPETSAWRTLANAPIRARYDATVVWTGSELVVWGGLDVAAGLPYSGGRYDDGGAAYDPATDTWRRIAEAPIEPREGAAAVWAGDRMIVVGGERFDGPPECPDRETCLGQGQVGLPTARAMVDGATYDPVADEWSPIADPPAPPGGIATWDGDEVLTFGPSVRGDQTSPPVGLAYDAGGDRWRELSVETDDGQALEFPRFAAGAGHAVAVAGAGDADGAWYVYDGTEGAWRRSTDRAPTPSAAGCDLIAARAGAALAVVGCGEASALYALDNDSWYPIDEAPPGGSPFESFERYFALGASDRMMVAQRPVMDGRRGHSRFVAYRGDFSAYTVPDVEGLTLGEARRIMEADGFVLSTHETDPQSPDAVVRAQEPPAGTRTLGIAPEVGVRTDPPG